MVQYTQLIYAQPSLSGYGGGGTEVIPESGDHRSNVPGIPPYTHTHSQARTHTHARARANTHIYCGNGKLENG